MSDADTPPETFGTQRHPNDPDTPVLRVLPCVKCGDRHTVDVSGILAESGLDAAWAEATQALPEGWALWGVRFRAPARSRPRGQYEAWAGPVGLHEAAPWPRPSRGHSGYSADTPAAALHALVARLSSAKDPA